MEPADRVNVTLLADSRGFDTYYLNDAYETYYGYDSTFPFLVRRSLLTGGASLDLVHIPDHFRRGNVQNNLLRVAMTNPARIYLLDGIWDTLLNRGHFETYAKDRIEEHSLRSGEPLELVLSYESLTDLFLADQLPISPSRYAARISYLVSYFLRRRRSVCWLSIIAPSPDHLGGLHFAGNYRPIPTWRRCIEGVNERVRATIVPWGAEVLELRELVDDHGGEAASLIDQWHFTESFHRRLSEWLVEDIEREQDLETIPRSHVSTALMVPGVDDPEVPLHVTGRHATAWLREHPERDASHLIDQDRAGDLGDAAILLVEDEASRDESARELLRISRSSTIVVYPEEISGLDNPLGEGALGP